MKAIAINGSPRKGWNTDMLLQQALRGAADAGAETELIQLSDLTFSGCRSCFACRRAGAETGRCMWKDDLQPVLDKIHSADAVFMGSPIYLGNVSGMMYCLMERLGGSSEYYAACDTLQFDDYSKFAAGSFNEAHKRKVREEQFPKDLQAAYDIGFRLITKGK